MAFVGESRRNSASPWKHFVCLNAKECRQLLPIVKKELAKAEEHVEKYQGLNEAGTITARQVNVFDKWVERADALTSVLNAIASIINNELGYIDIK